MSAFFFYEYRAILEHISEHGSKNKSCIGSYHCCLLQHTVGIYLITVHSFTEWSSFRGYSMSGMD